MRLFTGRYFLNSNKGKTARDGDKEGGGIDKDNIRFDSEFTMVAEKGASMFIRSVETVTGVERIVFQYIEPRSLPKIFNAAMVSVEVIGQLAIMLETNIPIKSLCDGYPTMANASCTC